ncbi:uncharacterized protein LOC121887991 isoform X1 [Thunnus maccoyii]|uniref:uncharacterized protein LOC121887991 isoform X1 n=1 Tax=Thunnus maccoyii TaxID=8240 RepID=UPI001C4D90BA|nr:uncharacterized protein LOC121887991 isoform X1 [Thunnus maccoyii]
MSGDIEKTCRICKINLVIKGVITNSRILFKSTNKNERPLWERFRDVGILLPCRPGVSSGRICLKCFRQLVRVEDSQIILKKWKTELDVTHTNEGGSRGEEKRDRDTLTNNITPQEKTLCQSLNPASHSSTTELQDNQAVMDRPRGQSRSIGIQVNTPETCAATIEKPALQHIVDEEAIMQLMKTCPMCDRQCRCHKYSRGPYFIVFQKCYFCDFQRKWASQPEALNADAYKAYIPPRKKLKSNDSVTVEGEAQSSQRNKTNISESSVSESNRTLQCRVTVSKLSLDMINMHNK